MEVLSSLIQPQIWLEASVSIPHPLDTDLTLGNLIVLALITCQEGDLLDPNAANRQILLKRERIHVVYFTNIY